MKITIYKTVLNELYSIFPNFEPKYNPEFE